MEHRIDRYRAVAVQDRPRSVARGAFMLTALNGALLALLGLAVPRATFGQAASTTPALPTIVLVHGAWAGPGGWDQVVGLLQAAGYETVTPTLDEATLTGDVAIVTAALDGITGPKVLVGHSYGGMVISGAGADRSDVSALVYTAGLVPAEGDSAFSVQDGFRQSELVHHLVFDPEPFAYIDRAFFAGIFCQDLDAGQASVLNDGQRPVSLAALQEPSGPVAWSAVPSWYAISGQDLVIDPAAQEFMSDRAGSTVVRFEDASHAGGFTRYAPQLVELIKEAVTSPSTSAGRSAA